MTLEDAIKHCEEIARTCENEKCSIEHNQLKEWLIELKMYREKGK